MLDGDRYNALPNTRMSFENLQGKNLRRGLPLIFLLHQVFASYRDVHVWKHMHLKRLFARHPLLFVREETIQQNNEILEGSLISGDVECRAPLHEGTNSIGILIISYYKPNERIFCKVGQARRHVIILRIFLL